MASNKKKKKPQQKLTKDRQNSGRPVRGVPVKQPKPWGLIITFGVVGIVALGLIGGAAFVVWDRSQPPEDITSFYGPYDTYQEVQTALSDGEITEEDLDHPWVVQQNHVDADEAWDGTPPTYEIEPPAGGNHLSQWQTCTGMVYDAPIENGNAVHSLEHGALWLTYDPEALSEDEIAQLAEKIEGRDYTLMSPYPGQGAAVSLQAWGTQYQTDDVADSRIDEYLNFAIQNSDNLAEMNATCSGGVSTTTADTAPAGG